MPWIAAIGAISGMAGTVAQQGQFDQSEMDRKQAIAQWLQLNVPDPTQQQLILQKYQQTGQLDPQIEQAMTQGKSQLGGITTDQNLQNSQMQALGQLQSEGMSGGLTLQDQAANQDAINNSNASARGRSGSIQDQMQQRGMGDSGLGLVAQMQNAQNANQTQAQSSLQAAADSRARALQAIQGAGGLAGQIQQQQYGQKANAAQAQDSINRFNTQNMQSVQERNVASQNRAQAYNVQNAQNIANQNTGLNNYQQQYNKQLLQQGYQDQLQKTAGATGQYNANANASLNQAKQTGEMFGQIGSGLTKAAGAYASKNNNDNSDDEE